MFLLTKLAGGVARLIAELKAEAEAEGLAWRTIERAKIKLKLVRGGSYGTFTWSLPNSGANPRFESAGGKVEDVFKA